MSAAVSKVIDLNKKNISASVIFLSGTTDSKTKAKYITSTYMELIRRLSRLGLKASIHIRAEQLGFFIDEESSLNNFTEILSTGNKFGVFVWLELPEKNFNMYKHLNGTKGYGVVFHERDVKNMFEMYKTNNPTKIVFDEVHNSNEKNKKSSQKKNIDKFIKNTKNLVLSSPPDYLVKEILSIKNKYKNNIAIEFKLGYSSKKLIKLVKKNKNIIINVPFGKDWAEFAMNSVPEGYMRFLANNLLSEKKEK